MQAELLVVQRQRVIFVAFSKKGSMVRISPARIPHDVQTYHCGRSARYLIMYCIDLVKVNYEDTTLERFHTTVVVRIRAASCLFLSCLHPVQVSARQLVPP